MLVLTRRAGEEIVIDGGIRVTVLSISRSQVRLGITAPRHIHVDRLEIHARRQNSDGKTINDDGRNHEGESAPLPGARRKSEPNHQIAQV